MTDPRLISRLREMTYADALLYLVEEFPTNEALVFKGQRWTFRDVKRLVDRASGRLATLGLPLGSSIAIWLPNRPEYLWYLLGAAQMGLVPVIMNTRLRADEFAYQLLQSDSRAVIVPGDGSFRDFLGDLADLCPALRSADRKSFASDALPLMRHVIALDSWNQHLSGVTDWTRGLEEDLPVPPYATDPTKPALISYSSGTTALPKGAMITHCVWRKAWDIGIRVDLTERDKFYLAIPMFGSMATMNGVFPYWIRGAGIVLAERFDAEQAMMDWQNERCTGAHLLPPMITSLIEHPRRNQYDISSMRLGIVLSNDPDVLRKVPEVLGIPGMLTGYGLTESTTAITRNRWDDPLAVRLASQGKPLPDVELKIVDPPTGNALPAAQSGEILVRSYCITPGYYNKPEETARALRGGWFHTGDQGFLDAEGRLVFEGRIGDGYKTKGFNVSPAEIETLLRKHPSVANASVVGMPDAEWGDVGVAFVIPRPASSVSENEIIAFARSNLASFKVPPHVVFVDAFPMTSGTEKIQKFKLRKMAADRFGVALKRASPVDAPAGQALNPFEGKTYAQAIEILAERYGERRALVFRDSRYSFREVKSEVDKASRRLATLGLARGDTIAIWLPNRPEFIWYWLAASQMGLLTVFLNTRLKQAEFMYQIGQSQSRALIAAGAGAFRDFLGELYAGCPELATQSAGSLAIAALPDLRHVIALDPVAGGLSGVTDWSAASVAAGPIPPLESDPGRPALIGYSSGTTALPKGAMLTHCVWRKAWDGGVRFDLTTDDCLFHTVPLFGVLGFLSGVLMFWTHGCGIVLDDKFDAGRCIRLMRDERCTCVHLLPVMIEEILAHPDFPAGGLPGLRAGIVLSNDPAVMRRAAEKLGVRGASAGYGMTESTGLVTRGKWDAPLEERLKSHGPPLPGCEIRIVDPDSGKDLPAGEIGEIWIGGYSVMAGYYNKPAETAEAITADGWLRSGDAGYLNPDGTLVFLHRLKDGYKHNGFNVSTPEIEAVMRSHPGIAAAAVVGIPHDRFGEIGVAFAIAKPDAAVDEEEVLAFLRQRLASFKLPAGIRFVDEFPLTAGTEKIQKFKLKRLAIEQFGRNAKASMLAEDRRAGRAGQ